MARAAETVTTLPPPRETLALDFANTRYWRGSETPTEELGDFATLARWCRANAALPVAPKIANPRAALASALELREAIYRAFLAAAEGKAPPGVDIRLIGRDEPKGPLRLGILQARAGLAWRISLPAEGGIETLLAPIRWSAWDLLLGSRLARVKRCANARCRYLFLDASKGGTRRWCSMAACGNRAKAHRHYVKSKKG